MKVRFNAKILGHEIFLPDPKDRPRDEAVRVKLAISSEKPLGKAMKGVIPIDKADVVHYPLGTYLRITVEDSQQVLELAGPPKARKPAREQGSLDDPEGTTTPAPQPLVCSIEGCRADTVPGSDYCAAHGIERAAPGPELVRDPNGGRRRRARPPRNVH